MEMVTVDPDDGRDFPLWFAVVDVAERLRDPFDTGWRPQEWRAFAADEADGQRVEFFNFLEGEEVVAAAAMFFSLHEMSERARLEIYVHPAVRRRGYGTEALRQCEAYIVSQGRTECLVTVREGSYEVATAPNRTFAPSHGYTLADEGRRRDLTWPRPEGELSRLRASALSSAPGYEIITYLAPTDEMWLDDRARLMGLMPADMPTIDLETTPSVFDSKRLLAHEAMVDEMGRCLLVAVALSWETGRLVGFSELTVSRAAPQFARQWDTFVEQDYRGHRLGLLMKIANLFQLATLGLEVRTISTFNSLLNDPMVAVNEALGATVTGVLGVVGQRPDRGGPRRSSPAGNTFWR
jgi:GNAT superfamily N-acetyltransferase